LAYHDNNLTTNGTATILFKDRVFPRNNATPSTLRLGQTPRTSFPEIKSERFDGYQHNLTSHPMTKRRKQSMSPRVKTVHNQQSISQNTENLAIATLHQQREIKD
jgi:hypothetical protein